MDEYTYAHKDTSLNERSTPTAKFNIAHTDEGLSAVRAGAFARHIPTADNETLTFLMTVVRAIQPKRILELGTATGASGIAMLQSSPNSHLTTVEVDEQFFSEAKANFAACNLSQRVTPVLCDAGEYISAEKEQYDFIFLDCAKVQYVKYLPHLKRLLKPGATLLADDVLLFGWLTGEAEVPKKRKMLFKHIEEYVHAVTCDSELSTVILNVGDGVAMSVKK